MMIKNKFTKKQKEMQEEVEAAAKDANLDFFDTKFLVLDYDEFNKIVANVGFPRRYSHWSFGMEYKKLSKQIGHGFSRIYELVINNDPAIGYIVNTSAEIHQKFVMAHVYGHVDFFKNNYMFEHTNRNMLNTTSNHADIIKKHIDKHGEVTVEKFIDACLSLDRLIDLESVRMQKEQFSDDDEDDCDMASDCASCQGCSGGSCGPKDNLKDKQYRIKTDYAYMDEFINTPKFLEMQKKRMQKEKQKKKIFPPEPEKDVLLFLLQNSDTLKPWQRDILSIIRDEAYYFRPQMATKIMNEGWASYWHTHLMVEKGLAGDSGIVEVAKTNASVLKSSKTSINPYHLGYLLFKDIKERWDKGQHGPEFEREKYYQNRKKWDTGDMKGLEKLFEVRKTRNDLEFIREFMTDDFIRENLLYSFKLDPDDDFYKIASKEPQHIRNLFLTQLSNQGEPTIKIHNANYRNAKELLLAHHFEGRILDINKAQKTLESIHKLWGRPVYIHTRNQEGLPLMYAFDGKEHKKHQHKK